MDDDSANRQPKLQRNFSVSDHIWMGDLLEEQILSFDNNIKSLQSDDEYVACVADSPFLLLCFSLQCQIALQWRIDLVMTK